MIYPVPLVPPSLPTTSGAPFAVPAQVGKYASFTIIVDVSGLGWNVITISSGFGLVTLVRLSLTSSSL